MRASSSPAQQQRSKLHSSLTHRSQPAVQELNEDLRIWPPIWVLCRQPGPVLSLSSARALALGPSAGMVGQRHQASCSGTACRDKMRAGYSTLIQIAQYFSTRNSIFFFSQRNYWQRKIQLSMKIGIGIRPLLNSQCSA